MTYTKKQFGTELRKKLLADDSFNEISGWAFKVYTERGIEFEKGLDCFVLKLIAMGEGPEFALSKEELISLADELLF